jgi:hypothetical protein
MGRLTPDCLFQKKDSRGVSEGESLTNKGGGR